MIEKKNYYGIDLLKFIMAVCVVAIHTQPLYSVQSIVVQRLFDTITSLAEPYFFSVSGFLLFSKMVSNEPQMRSNHISIHRPAFHLQILYSPCRHPRSREASHHLEYYLSANNYFWIQGK